jgi:hypothetical protein
MVLMINLLYLIFYKLDSGKESIAMSYTSAEIAIEALGIIQAFFAFLVMTSYIMRYHGKIYEQYIEQHQMKSNHRFTYVKGSLGYAFGSEVYKLSHQAA